MFASDTVSTTLVMKSEVGMIFCSSFSALFTDTSCMLKALVALKLEFAVGSYPMIAIIRLCLILL